MGNNYFQFKQFKIDQDLAAMKVSTEGCLLGALADHRKSGSVLDVGTGTGLLALMLAQRTAGNITSVEADGDSCKQARLNIEASPWGKRIEVVHQTIQNFAENCTSTFDLIVSNPPFYTNYLPSDDIRRKLAMHTYSLSMEDLAGVVEKLLSNDGLFYVLYPAYEAGIFAQTAGRQGLFPHKNFIIKNKPDGPIFRMITGYGKSKVVNQQTSITIRDVEGSYTEEFKELMSPYYLNF